MKNLNKFYSTKKAHEKLDINNYLLGNNKNLVGTIIAFRKRLIKSDYYEFWNKVALDQGKNKNYTPEAFSVMLYFDHRIAKIVRYLFNPNLVFWGRKPEFYNFCENDSQAIETINGVPVNNYPIHMKPENLLDRPRFSTPTFQYNYIDGIHDEKKGNVPAVVIDHSTVLHGFTPLHLMYKKLYDGKISKDMLITFTADLLRSYLVQGLIYNTCDMNTIYHNTIYEYKLDKDKYEKLENLTIDSLTTDKIKLIDVSFTSTDKQFISYPKDKHVIYYPKSVNFNNEIINGYKNHNCYLEQMELNEHPQVIKDLRKYINPNVIQNKKFLDDRIAIFNKSLDLKLNSLTKNSTPLL